MSYYNYLCILYLSEWKLVDWFARLLLASQIFSTDFEYCFFIGMSPLEELLRHCAYSSKFFCSCDRESRVCPNDEADVISGALKSASQSVEFSEELDELTCE